jgi:hypothetical protein
VYHTCTRSALHPYAVILKRRRGEKGFPLSQRNYCSVISARCTTRGPQIQRVLAHPPTASVTRRNSGEVVELFDGGWLELGEDLSHVRVIVVRHAAPPPGKDIPVGKRVGEWVYELFITTLGADGFLVEDVLDLYHGRGAFEAVLADEDVEDFNHCRGRYPVTRPQVLSPTHYQWLETLAILRRMASVSSHW